MAESNEYPISSRSLNKQAWNKRVSATHMPNYSAEAQTLPILVEWVQLLERLTTLPVQQTLLDQEAVEFFFNGCFSQICQKLINSKYFRNPQVTQLSNRVMELCVDLYEQKLPLTKKYPKFAELLAIVFDAEAQYFKTNNQMGEPKAYPWIYYGQVQHNAFLETLPIGSQLDAVKYDSSVKKATWSRALLKEVEEGFITVAYLNDCKNAERDIVSDSVDLAPLGTHSTDFEWRMQLKEGDLIDCCQSYGSWFTATIVKVRDCPTGKKLRVTFKVYDKDGQRSNQKGPYFGMSDTYDQDDVDISSPRIQRLNTVAKYKDYSTTSNHIDYLNDTNDHVFEYVNGERISFIPRAKYNSEFLFKLVRKFASRGGFERMLEALEARNDGDLMYAYTVAIGNLACNLHRGIVKELLPRLKAALNRHLVDESEAIVKSLTKERYEHIFCALKNLSKRIQSIDQYREFEVQSKLILANICLKSETLKRRLHGLAELKDILRAVRMNGKAGTTGRIGTWLRENRVFEKIYVEDRHVQLIKKSTEFFRFLISQGILEVDQLKLVYSAAQKGDHQTRLAIYKLLQQVSNSFKRPHVDFLIDQILQSQIGLVACEDLQLLHELSRYSNYFPLQKVVPFFERILLSPHSQPQLLEVSVKKYAEIVFKNEEMAAYRKDVVVRFMGELQKDSVGLAVKVISAIFENVGDRNKYELYGIVNDIGFDIKILQAITKHQNSADYLSILQRLLNLLLSVVALSQRVKISVSTFITLWKLLRRNATHDKERELYANWCAAISKLDNVLADCPEQELYGFFKQIIENINELNAQDFEIVATLFLDINVKLRNIFASTVYRNGREEKQLRVTTEFMRMKFYDELLRIIYEVGDEKVAEQAIEFYNNIYLIQQPTPTQRQLYLQSTLNHFFKLLKDKHIQLVPRTLKLIDFIIDESQKSISSSHLKSLATMLKGQPVNLQIVNQIVYSYDSVPGAKNFTFKTDSNSNLFQLRSKLASTLSMSWQQLKIAQKEELQDILNSRLIKELNIKPNQPLKVSKRAYNQPSPEELVVNGKLSTKAVKAFESVFARFSTDGLMSKDDCYKFIVVCLGDGTFKNYQDRIVSVFNRYDDDKDDQLTLKNFLEFYEDSAKDRPTTVWANLRSCRIRHDFKSFDQPQQSVVDVTQLPRYLLGQRPDFYQALFSLLDQQQTIAKATWKMFQRLQISSTLYNQVLSGDLDTQWKLLSLQSPYKMLYCLYLFEYLLDTTSEKVKKEEQEWREGFEKGNGFERLFEIYKRLRKQEKLKQIEQDIMEFLLNMITKFVLDAFNKTKDSWRVNAVLSSQLEFHELLPLMISMEMPKDMKNEAKIKQYNLILEADVQNTNRQWKGCSRQQLVDVIISSILLLWQQTTNLIQRDSQLSNCLHMLLALLLNHDTSKLRAVLPILLPKCPSLTILRQLYLLILSLCMFGKGDAKEPHLMITCLLEFLKGKKEEVINEEYFKTVAMLINRFGLETVNSEIPDILLKNVLESDKEQTIQGCALMLSYINKQQVQPATLKRIWQRCLFGRNFTCKTQGPRQSVYSLLSSLTLSNPLLSSSLTTLTISTIHCQIHRLKVLSQHQLRNRSPYNYAGLKNLGAVCYMLAIIQQFYMNKPFRNLFMRIDDGRKPNMVDNKGRMVDDNLLHQLQVLFGYLSKTERMEYNPQDFCFSWKDMNGEPANLIIQQDAQEFISMLLDRLEEGMKKTPFRKIVDCTYTGQVSNLFTCEQCKKMKSREENFYCLSLEVKNYKNLEQSLGKLIKGETISDYTCDFCGKKVEVVKKTVISKCPNYLVLHLQRLVFNLDTFLNEKISDRFEFPLELNLQPYTLESTLSTPQQPQTSPQSPQPNPQSFPQPPPDSSYHLVGIVAHRGMADTGHYYSFIKTQTGQWLEFNDSNIYSFDLKKLQSECYGGTTESIQDEFDWTRKESKNAYMLVYEKNKKTGIDLVFASEREKRDVMDGLQLTEKKREQPVGSINDIRDQDQESTPSEIVQKKEVEKEIPKLQDSPQKEVSKDTPTKQEPNKPKQIIVEVEQPISDYIPPNLLAEIIQDNHFHQYEVNICSNSLIKFFTNLLTSNLTDQQYTKMVDLANKLAFNVWIKQPKVKQLIQSLNKILIKQPIHGLPILLQQHTKTSYLIQHDNSDVRTAICNLLLTITKQCIEKYNLKLTKENEIDTTIVEFLDGMFGLIPTTVSKNWARFTQYWQFWRDFANQGVVQFQYMIRKEAISHFIDYFLEKKSPLGIYANKKFAIGGKHSTNPPNFGPLFEAVSILVSKLSEVNPDGLTSNDKKVLMNFDFYYKMISENNGKYTNNLISSLCKNSLPLSQKVAIVLIRGVYNCTYNNAQPFLDAISTFIQIKDEYRDYRLKWVYGMPTIVLSSIDKSVAAFNKYSIEIEQRLYVYESTLQIDQTCSLLEWLVRNITRTQVYCTLMLKSLLLVCLEDDYVMDYVVGLPAPSLVYGRYIDFFGPFIENVLKDKMSTIQCPLAKAERGKEAQEVHVKFLEKLRARERMNENPVEDNVKEEVRETKNVEFKENNGKVEEEPQKVNGKEKTKEQERKEEQVKEIQKPKQQEHKQTTAVPTTDQPHKQQQPPLTIPMPPTPSQILPNSPSSSSSDTQPLQPQPPTPTHQAYHPCRFLYEPTGSTNLSGLVLTHHLSKLILIKTKPNGIRNELFKNTIQPLIDRIPAEAWANKREEQVQGIYIYNSTRDSYRIKWKYGTVMLRAMDSYFLWAAEVEKAWVVVDRNDRDEWPKWTLHM